MKSFQPELICILTLHLVHISVSGERFQVLGPAHPIIAVAGDDTILPCYIEPNISAVDLRIEWFRSDLTDSTVHLYMDHTDRYEDQNPSYRGRTSLFKEELKRGNTSLKLTNVQISDDGTYKCFIQSNTWYDDSNIRLVVTAVGSQPVISIEGQREGGVGLVCESKGWYPEPGMVWMDSEGIILTAGSPEIHRDHKGFYTMKLKVIVQERDTNIFTCRVHLEETNQMKETKLNIPGELFPHDQTWVGIMLAVCLFLLFIAVVGYILYKTIKDKFTRKPNPDLVRYFYDKITAEKRNEKLKVDAVDVTLDPDTAHPDLILSEDGKQVRCEKTKKNLPDNPERFDLEPCVLGKEGFSSGRFYYEVQVKGNKEWCLGVASESVVRKGNIPLRPKNGFWTVGLKLGVYEALTSSSNPLFQRKDLEKVKVFVDYEEGQVSFYNTDNKSLIYHYNDNTFTGKLYPFFRVSDRSSAPLIILKNDDGATKSNQPITSPFLGTK